MSEIGQKLIEATRKAAEDNPDYVYEGGCVYVRNGQPSCLIGHAAWNVGLINSDLEHVDANTGGVLVLLYALGLHHYLGNQESLWLMEAQSAQDTEKPWGKAVETADRRVLL